MAALFILSGVFVLIVATLGLYRLHYVLNRIHASAKCDTLGTMLILIGVCILTGFTFTTLKVAALVVFLWLSNPAALFMIGRAEVLTNPHLNDEVDILVVKSPEGEEAEVTEE